MEGRTPDPPQPPSLGPGPAARLAALGYLADVHLTPLPVATGEGTVEGGGSSPAAGLPLDQLVANIAASLTLAGFALSSPGSHGEVGRPPFQLRGCTLQITAHAEWSTQGHILLRSIQPGAAAGAPSPSQVTVHFEPVPLPTGPAADAPPPRPR